MVFETNQTGYGRNYGGEQVKESGRPEYDPEVAYIGSIATSEDAPTESSQETDDQVEEEQTA